MNTPSGVSYSEKQKAFMQTSCEKAALIGGRQSGKTEALCGIAVAYASDGYEVVFGTPMQRMCKEVMKRLQTHIGSNSVTNTQDKLKLPSGGEIRMTSFSQPVKGSQYSPDVLLIDEFTDIRQEKLDNVEIKKSTRVYAAGTPRNLEIPFIDESWDITLARSESNPKVNQNQLRQWQDYQENGRLPLMKPIEANQHGLFPVETGAGKIYKCLFCGFEERVPEEAPGTCDKYAIGRAIRTSCA